MLQRDDIILQMGECVYPMSPAFLLGLVALAMLLLAVSWITGCESCTNNRREGISKRSFVCGIVFAVVSWLLTIMAVYLFVVALVANRPGMRGKAPCDTYVPKDNFFGWGGAITFWATFFGISSHKLFRFGAP